MAHIRQQSDDGQARTAYVVARGWSVQDTAGRLAVAGDTINLTDDEAQRYHYRLDPDPFPELAVVPPGSGIPKAKNAEERAEERAVQAEEKKAAAEKAKANRKAA